MLWELSQEDVARVQRIVNDPPCTKVQQLAVQLKEANNTLALHAIKAWFETLPANQQHSVLQTPSHRQ